MATERILSVVATVGSKLPDLAIRDGQLIFVQDKHKIAMDMDGKRVFYNQIIELANEQSRASLLAPLVGSYYFVIDTAVLWAYRTEGWIQITTPPKDIVCIGIQLPELGKAGVLYIDTSRHEVSVWDSDANAYMVVADATTEITPGEIDAIFAEITKG